MPALEIGGDRRGKGISKHKEGIEESSQMPALSMTSTSTPESM